MGNSRTIDVQCTCIRVAVKLAISWTAPVLHADMGVCSCIEEAATCRGQEPWRPVATYCRATVMQSTAE
jgi:hypothetical protein